MGEHIERLLLLDKAFDVSFDPKLDPTPWEVFIFTGAEDMIGAKGQLGLGATLSEAVEAALVDEAT